MGWIKRVKPPHECNPPIPRINFFPHAVGSLWGCRKCGQTHRLAVNHTTRNYMHAYRWEKLDQ